MLSVVFTIMAASLDGLACGFVMGIRNIKITYRNILLMSLFPFTIAYFGMETAHALLPLMDEETARFLGIALYFAMALYSLISARMKEANETWMDTNNDHQITGMEVVSTGLALSIDTLIVAMPLAFLGYSSLLCAVLFALFGGSCLVLGRHLSLVVPKGHCQDASRYSWLLYLALGVRRLF